MAADRWSEMLALAACVVGLVVVVMAWPRRQGDRAQAGEPPRPAPAPIAVKLDTIGEEPRWRVANRHGILNVSIDIVAFRPAEADGPWESEPIDEPITLSPGRSTTLPSVVGEPTLPHDVVVAWTLHHLDGAASHRQTFRVSPDAEVPVAPASVVVASGPTGGMARVYAVIAVLLVVTGTAAAWRLLASSEVSSGVAALPSGTAEAPAASSVAPATSTLPTPVTEGTTATAAAAPAATAAPSTTAAPATTTSTSTTTTTAAPAPTSAPTTSTLPYPRVMIEAEVGPCQFGPSCLVASFRLDGFPREGNYICEFRDGSRFTFRYEGDGADRACAASGRDPSITIEVDGVRSATITRDSLNGE